MSRIATLDTGLSQFLDHSTLEKVDFLCSLGQKYSAQRGTLLALRADAYGAYRQIPCPPLTRRDCEQFGRGFRGAIR